MNIERAVANSTARCVWIPSTVPESTPPPYPVLCTATPSRENKMDPRIVCWHNWNRGEAEKLKQKSIQGKGGRVDSWKSCEKEPTSAGQRGRRKGQHSREQTREREPNASGSPELPASF